MNQHLSPRLSAIAAMDEQGAIGKNNTLPWHLPADLQHFKAITTGHPILMGRKTYESIGRPLPNRMNIILTSNPTYMADGCYVVRSVEEGLALAHKADQQEVFVIGGAEVYKQLLPHIARLYLTIIHHRFEGDTFFPALNLQEWREISKEDHTADEKNAFNYTFLILERKH